MKCFFCVKGESIGYSKVRNIRVLRCQTCTEKIEGMNQEQLINLMFGINQSRKLGLEKLVVSHDKGTVEFDCPKDIA